MTRSVYLDYNATAPLRPEARSALLAAAEIGGNASSVHANGRAARARIDEARAARVAALVGASPENVIFTSGGTEANDLALSGIGAAAILTSSIEHDSVHRNDSGGGTDSRKQRWLGFVGAACRRPGRNIASIACIHYGSQ